MMRVEDVGFFRELPHGDPQGPSLWELLDKGDVETRDGVANYLAIGSILATTGEHVFDVLKDEKLDAGLLAIQTDGRWVWPADLAYYVREHNVQLPLEFVDWARAAAWTAPELAREELVQVEKFLFPETSA